MLRKAFGKHKIAFLISLLFLLVTLNLIFIRTSNRNNYDLSLKSLLVSSKLETLCKDCNVIMVSLDTLSSNHLPCYGYYRDTSPNLCAFADKNILFENAYSNATWTLPSHVSLFTGLYPFRAGVNKSLDKLGDDKVLLPQLLKSHGYNTLFFLPQDFVSFPLDNVYGRLGDSIYLNTNYTWQQSIEMFKQSVKDKKKTFMFLHTYDVHEPFMIGHMQQIYPPINTKLPTNWDDYSNNLWTPEFVNFLVSTIRNGIDSNWVFQGDRKDAEVLFPELMKAIPNYNKEVEVLKKISNTGMLWNFILDERYNKLIDKNNVEDLASLSALYDQTINNLDNQKITLLTDLIENPEFKDNTILIIFADHGEEFMEHGQLYHVTIYNSNTRVPLIMHIPGIQNKKIFQSVQLVDIFPSLTEILGIKNNIQLDGKSLIRRIYGFDKSNELIVSDGLNLDKKALIYGPWKLLLGVLPDKKYIPYELFNIYNDPAEKYNILFQNTEIKDQLLKKYPYPLKIN